MTAEHIVWAFLGIVGGLIVLSVYKKYNKDYVTKEECDRRRNQCEVCRDVGTIKEVIFDVATHLGVPSEKYKELITRRRDDD